MKNIFCIWLSLFLSSCSYIKYSLQDVIQIGYKSTVYIDTATGHCTGFAIDYDIVATAGHCITEQTAVFMFYGTNGIIAEVLIDDDTRDIAILRTLDPIPNIVPAMVSEDILQPGEKLIATGYPFYTGKEIIFNVGQFLGYSGPELVATDVCLRGNSGGPVLNEMGQVVGICSKIAPIIDIYDETHHTHKDINMLVPIKYVREMLK